MKLIYCPACDDVVKLHPELTTCRCGRSYGMYAPDGLNALYGGRAVPLGFANSSLMFAINMQPESGDGQRFEAFVIPKQCPTFHKLEEPKKTRKMRKTRKTRKPHGKRPG
jgi:hypothetical protein